MLAIFSWQTYNACQQYAQGKLALALEMTYPESLDFPSLSFCPQGGVSSVNQTYYSIPEELVEENYDCTLEGSNEEDCQTSFAQQLAENGPNFDFLLQFEHDRLEM